MYPIYQRYASDCFPTCVAMITGISHRHAMMLIHPFHRRGSDYSTEDKDAIRILRFLGCKVRKRYIKDFEYLKNIAILVIEDEGTYHVSVWDPNRKLVLEPIRGWYQPVSYYKEKLQYVYIIS